MFKKIVFLSFSLLFGIVALAQDTLHSSKVITNARLTGIGHVNQLDTYLSPSEYKGGEVRYVSHTIRENGTPISREIIHQARFTYTHNPSKRNNNIGGLYNLQYNILYSVGHWKLGNGFLLAKIGGGIDVNLGFLYNIKNGNNPGQAYVNLNLAPVVAAQYAFRLWQRPFLISYSAQAPLVGMMFAPNFGQSYYEIFSKGNYDHNLVPTTIGTTPSLRQLLTLDFTIHHTTLRLGYLGDFQQAEVNGLKYHTWSNLFMIGVVRKFSIIKFLP